MGYDTLDVYPHVYLDWLQEETARWRAQMEEAVMRKSPSVAGSYTSVEAFVPRRRKTSKDKDALSVHSEKMTNYLYRRFSLANGRAACKVELHYFDLLWIN